MAEIAEANAQPARAGVAHLTMIQRQIIWMEGLSIVMKVFAAMLVLVLLSPIYGSIRSGEQALVMLFGTALLIVTWAGDNYFFGRRAGYIWLFDRARTGQVDEFDMNEAPYRNARCPWIRDGVYLVAVVIVLLATLMRW